MAGFDDIVRMAMRSVGMAPPEPDPNVPDVSIAPPMRQYPGAPEVEDARKADFSYGSGNEGFNEGRVARKLQIDAQGVGTRQLTDPRFGKTTKGDPQLAQNYEAAQLAVNRSPISALGYDPRMINVDDKSGPNVNMYGAYSPNNDGVYSNSSQPSNLVHESTHRGLEKLRTSGVLTPELDKRLPRDEEDIVRYIMASQMGDPEGGKENKYRNTALYKFGVSLGDPTLVDRGALNRQRGDDYRAALDELTKAAAQHLYKLHPGGPR
jgi:hypothetical protein